MGLAALFIIIFHFWMPLTNTMIEASIYRSTYIGVDIFFLVSAYSLSKREHINYLEFIRNRLLNVYLPFVIMAIICAIYKRWNILQLLKVVSGVEFFTKGGGSFLWFAIAIMLIYLMAPGVIILKNKTGWKAGALVILAWLIIVVVLQYVFDYSTIFIMLNRIPIFVLGLCYEDIKRVLGKCESACIVTGLILGGIIIYFCCSNVRISKPITDIYYLFVIPFTVAFVLLFDYLSDRINLQEGLLGFVGSFTLEIYGMQMIFGYAIETKIFKFLRVLILILPIAKIITFVLTVFILILLAWAFNLLKKYLMGKIVKRG